MIVYDNHTKLFFHETHFTLGAKFIVASGSSLDMYICIHVRDKGIHSGGI